MGDVVLGNLEGTLATGGASKCGAGSSNCFAFRTPPSYARWLKGAGFTVMNLANNHAYDFGPSAQRETVAALTRVGLLNTGRPGTQATQTVGGQRVALLGFAPYKWADSLTDIARAKRRVREAAAHAEIVVVTFHGGAEGSDQTHVPSGTETFLGENRGDLRRFTHAVVDAGADLVVGSGPHVLRGMEVYRGRLIAYSMGNFGGYKVFGLGGRALHERRPAGDAVAGRAVPLGTVPAHPARGVGHPGPGRVRRLPGAGALARRTSGRGRRASTPPAGSARLDEPPQELTRLGVLRVPQDPVGLALLQHPPLVQEADEVGHVAGELHLVGGDQHRHPLALQLADHLQHLPHQLRVEGAGDLVQQQRPRAGGQRAHDRHPLLLPAGEAVGVVVLAAAQPEAREQLAAGGGGLPARRPVRLTGASVTFWSTDRCGNRLNDWNTIPSRRRLATGEASGR